MSFETPKKIHNISSIFGQKVQHQQLPFIYHVMIAVWLKSWNAIRQTWSVIKHTLNIWSNMGQWVWSCIALTTKKQLEPKNLNICSEVIAFGNVDLIMHMNVRHYRPYNAHTYMQHECS
jgi:hypothetical protein